MKIKLYPKELLEAAWKQDKKLYAHGAARVKIVQVKMREFPISNR